MPSFVTRKILSSERLADKVEEGRAKIYRDVQSEVQKQLSETAEKLKEPLLAQMVEILKARGRDPVQ
jgi:DNA-binding MurR/RpiR family transcriptional regulator